MKKYYDGLFSIAKAYHAQMGGKKGVQRLMKQESFHKSISPFLENKVGYSAYSQSDNIYIQEYFYIHDGKYPTKASFLPKISSSEIGHFSFTDTTLSFCFEGNRAADTFRYSYSYSLFEKLMKSINWSSGKGGCTRYMDEYMFDALSNPELIFRYGHGNWPE